MAFNFRFVGTLRPVKDTDKFKGFTEVKYNSGWMTQKLRFNVIAGDNRHLVEINAGKWVNEEKNVIYAIDTEGKSVKIPWSKRSDPETMNSIADWRIFTVDTDTRSHRKELEENGKDEELAVSQNKRKRFLANTDFCEYVNKVINSEKMNGKKFRVNGNVVYNYSEKTGKYYHTLEVNTIYMVDDDTEPSSTMDVDFYFTEGVVEELDDEKAIASGYTTFYDNQTKKSWFTPIDLIIRNGESEETKKKAMGLKTRLREIEENEVRYVRLNCQRFDGAQRRDITFDDLDDATKENIEWGLTTLEDAIRDAGGQMFDKVKTQEIRAVGFSRGFSGGSESTSYTIGDLLRKPIKEEVVVSDEIDIFSDEIDDDDL